MSIRVESAVTAEQRLVAFQLRWRIIEELGWTVPGATPERGVLEPIDEGASIYVAFDGQEPIGTAAVHDWAKADLPSEVVERLRLQPMADAFGRGSVLFTRKLLVARSYRGGGVAMQLYAAAARGEFKPETQFLVTDCAPELLPYYTGLGYRQYAPPFCYGQASEVALPICLVVSDVEHLEAVGGPMLALGRAIGIRDRPDVREFFLRTYGC